MRQRSVIEIMVLTFTFVVGFSLVMTGTAVAIVEIKDPSVDTETITQSLISLDIRYSWCITWINCWEDGSYE